MTYSSILQTISAINCRVWHTNIQFYRCKTCWPSFAKNVTWQTILKNFSQCFKYKQSFFDKTVFLLQNFQNLLTCYNEPKGLEGSKLANHFGDVVVVNHKICVSLHFVISQNSRDEIVVKILVFESSTEEMSMRGTSGREVLWRWGPRFRHLQTLSRKTCYQIAMMDTRKMIHFWEDIQCFKSKHSFQNMERSKIPFW